MPLWMIALTAYFVVGLMLAFVGPAARERRREQRKTELDTHNLPPWKLRAFALALIGGIVLLWPYLVPSAARIGRRPARSLCRN
jgi:cytochrome bd-type quinol oxidase subunit 2